MDDRIVGFAVSVILYTNGVCPFCKKKVAEKSISIEDMKKHIIEEDELEKWSRVYERYFK